MRQDTLLRALLMNWLQRLLLPHLLRTERLVQLHDVFAVPFHVGWRLDGPFVVLPDVELRQFILLLGCFTRQDLLGLPLHTL